MKIDKGNKAIEIVTNGPQETVDFGKKIGGVLKGGEIFFLTGELGTGKTHLIKGISLGAGVEDGDDVNSPTFVLVNEYFCPETGLELYHIDAYRFDSIGEFETIGFDDFCHERGVVLIEWADKISSALEGIEAIEVKLYHIDEATRKIFIQNATEELLNQTG